MKPFEETTMWCRKPVFFLASLSKGICKQNYNLMTTSYMPGTVLWSLCELPHLILKTTVRVTVNLIVQWWNWGSSDLSKYPKVTGLVRGRNSIWT